MTVHTFRSPNGGLAARIKALRLRHQVLEARVAAEHGRPLPDMGILRGLKRERLRLKDELARCQGGMRGVQQAHPVTS